MVKGKEEKVEAETVVTPEAESAQTAVPTPEELEALITKAREEAKAEAEESYKGIQRTIAQKDKQIEKLKKTQPQDYSGSSQFYKALAEAGESGDYASVKSQIAELEQKQTYEAQYKQYQDFVGGKREEAEQKILDAKLNPADEALDSYWESFDYAERQTGNFDIADRKLERAISKAKPQSKEPVKKDLTEEEEEEIARKYLAKQGRLDTDTAPPSGGGGGGLTAKQIENMSPEERFARSEEIAKIPLGYTPLNK